MNKLKILIIETSESEKTDRLYTGKNEWKDGWRFIYNKDIALKFEDSEVIDYPDNFESIPCDKNCIIWLKWQKDKTKSTENITQLTDRCIHAIVYLTSHEIELLKNKNIKENLKIKRTSSAYSLDHGQASKFGKILNQDKKGIYLDAKAPFEDIFNCFFLHPPDVLALVIHKVNGILSTLDLDIQTLLDCNFRTDIRDDIAKSYKGREIVENVKGWIDGDEISLKRLNDQEKSRNNIVEEKFRKIVLLFENNKTKPLDDILCGFKADQINTVRNNIEGFRNWYKELLVAFEEFIEIIKVENEK